jgi:hypothetical protein
MDRRGLEKTRPELIQGGGSDLVLWLAANPDEHRGDPSSDGHRGWVGRQTGTSGIAKS